MNKIYSVSVSYLLRNGNTYQNQVGEGREGERCQKMHIELNSAPRQFTNSFIRFIHSFIRFTRYKLTFILISFVHASICSFVCRRVSTSIHRSSFCHFRFFPSAFLAVAFATGLATVFWAFPVAFATVFAVPGVPALVGAVVGAAFFVFRAPLEDAAVCLAAPPSGKRTNIPYFVLSMSELRKVV